MSKRNLSPGLLPPTKRLHTSTGHQRPTNRLNFDNSLYDELILCIFSHLSWIDLCAAQATSRNWARLATDNEIWRKLYLRTYGRARLRGTRGFVGRPDGRDIKPLPGRAKPEDRKDWRQMFRISTNWRRGRCNVVRLNLLTPCQHDFDRPHCIHMLLAGSLTITSSSKPSEHPKIDIRGPSGNDHAVLCDSRLPGEYSITALALDQSPPISSYIRFAVFLSTGEFTVFQNLHNQPISPTRKLVYVPTQRNDRISPIIQAVYNHPLLVTLSQSFALCIYDLSSDIARRTQTLTSFTSFPPSSLVLSTPTSTTYKLVLAYSIPVYPSHWSVGATELIISAAQASPLSPPALSSFSEHLKHPIADAMTVISTRTTRALDVPSGWIDEYKLRLMREQWNRKVSQVSDTQTDGKWVVLAPEDPSDQSNPSWRSNTHSTSSSSSDSPTSKLGPSRSPTSLQLYRLSLPTQSASISASPPKLTFVRTLHGPCGPVAAMALADGRCVSLSHNGAIWVWDLEGGTSAEVAAGDGSEIGSLSTASKGTVSFDERRIISASAGNIVARTFDI